MECYWEPQLLLSYFHLQFLTSILGTFEDKDVHCDSVLSPGRGRLDCHWSEVHAPRNLIAFIGSDAYLFRRLCGLVNTMVTWDFGPINVTMSKLTWIFFLIPFLLFSLECQIFLITHTRWCGHMCTNIHNQSCGGRGESGNKISHFMQLMNT